MSTSAKPLVNLETRRSPSVESVQMMGVPREQRDEDGLDEQDAHEGIEVDPEEKKIADAKKRYEADVAKYAADVTTVSRPEDDWQVAYIWAFIIRFNLRQRITRLECLEDLERCLHEPVANRPDDVLESILICFLSNLRPGSRNISAETIQANVSSYITEQLSTSAEWTVWDRSWPLNEENRASCCTDDPFRAELGRLRYYGEPLGNRAERNPIKRMEKRGGGLFELDWKERAGLLRQMVDWQLNHSESIRTFVNNSQKPIAKPKKGPAPKNAKKVEDEVVPIAVEPLGQNRNRQRIWSLDDSWRLYRSGNPFKRPCPLESITFTKDQYLAYLSELEEYGAQPQESGADHKLKGAALKRYVKGVQDEKKLGEILSEKVERVDREEARVQRAKRKIAQTVQLQQAAEMRSTRTRRPNRKVDYSYGDSGEDEEEPRKSSRRSVRGPPDEGYLSLDARGRPVVPGERRSARVSARGVRDEDFELATQYSVEQSAGIQVQDDVVEGVDEKARNVAAMGEEAGGTPKGYTSQSEGGAKSSEERVNDATHGQDAEAPLLAPSAPHSPVDIAPQDPQPSYPNGVHSPVVEPTKEGIKEGSTEVAMEVDQPQ